MNNKIKNLYDNCDNLRMLHHETAIIKHAIMDGKTAKEWTEYNPTHFIYVFFCFNALYSVNWNKSLKEGAIKYYERYNSEGTYIGISETKQYEKMLSFCFFNNNSFVYHFYKRFLNIIMMEYNEDDIFEIIETIEEDIKPNGRITEEKISSFKNAIEDLLINNKFEQSVLEHVIRFIYDIRCNVFHGTKELAEVLTNRKEKKKLKLYSYILIAVNQMILSYIDYLHKVDKRDDSYTLLINNLRSYAI